MLCTSYLNRGPVHGVCVPSEPITEEGLQRKADVHLSFNPVRNWNMMGIHIWLQELRCAPGTSTLDLASEPDV